MRYNIKIITSNKREEDQYVSSIFDPNIIKKSKGKDKQMLSKYDVDKNKQNKIKVIHYDNLSF